MRRVSVAVCAAVAALAAAIIAQELPGPRQLPGSEGVQRFEFAEPHMGTIARVVLYAADARDAERAARAAFARIGDLDRRLSDYRDDSELNIVCRAGAGLPVRVSDDLFAVLERAQALATQTDGAFDVTVAPVVQLWRRARRIGRVPAPQRLQEALARTGYRYLGLDATRRTVTFARAGMRLDVGGIAKGYAADQALAALVAGGVSRALVAIGGDIAVDDPPPDAAGWRVGVVPPGSSRAEASLEAGFTSVAPTSVTLTHAGISTSGDAEQHVEIEGVRYSHIIDPRTGVPVRGRTSVTVIARDAATSDGLATAASVLGPERGVTLVDGTPGASALITIETPQGRREYRSSRW